MTPGEWIAHASTRDKLLVAQGAAPDYPLPRDSDARAHVRVLVAEWFAEWHRASVYDGRLMAPGKKDLTIYQGDDFRMGVVILTALDGPALDLTGHAFTAQIRSAPADDDATVEAAMVVTVTDAAAGRLTVALPHADADLPAGSYVWDLEGTDGGGLITTYLAGKVKVTAEVTRP